MKIYPIRTEPGKGDYVVTLSLNERAVREIDDSQKLPEEFHIFINFVFMISNSSPSDYNEVSPIPSENESIISGFTDDNICGAGATCVVYQMNLQGLHVAVKRLRNEYLGNPIHEAAFRKEYSIGRQLKHDALPVYRDLRVDDSNVYIIMDFVDGCSLSELLDTDEGRRYFSSRDNVRRFLSELVGVMGYLHRKGVIHCDIKPANIMLRHSDRGLMLIDFDKAYCDTLDATHGGTSGFSNPMKSGDKPTAQKDFAAIGKIFDYIGENIPRFQLRHFSHFRRECDNPDTTPEKLNAVLRPKSHSGLWAVVVFSLVFLSGVGYYAYKNSLDAVNTEVSEPIPSPESKDTVRIEPDIPQKDIDTKPDLQDNSRIVINDIDKRMGKFISETQELLDSLTAGNVTDREILDMMSNVVENHSSSYHQLLTECKKEHPTVAGIDVELALARALEKSRVSSLMQQFTQAARDTIVSRHPETYKED